jgi:nicotinamidase-related amidase
MALSTLLATIAMGQDRSDERIYSNQLRRIENPQPILADHPEFFEPIVEEQRFEADAIVDDPMADLEVRAWRFSYNARGIIEMPNRLRADQTAIIMVHPWAIDDSWGWKTPQPCGVADFCTPSKNHLASRHSREVIDPFLKRLRQRVSLVMYSLPGPADPIRTMVYRSFHATPTDAQRQEGTKLLRDRLASFNYRGDPLPGRLILGDRHPVGDYFRQFPGLDASARFNGEGFWSLPIPVSDAIDVAPRDVVIFDDEGYPKLREFLQKKGIRHVLLTGYATDMCYCKTTAGYENLSRDFNVFLVADASLATFPSNSSPRFAVNASISYAALQQLITQVSWVQPIDTTMKEGSP